MNLEMAERNKQQILEQVRDHLINEVRTLAQNNLNMRHELNRDKSNLVKLVLAANKIRRRIQDESDTNKRIIREMKTILKSYCSHLEYLEMEADKDCELDWKMLQAGETDNFSNFLENFLEHRKDYHLYKIKAKRLSKDLCILDNIMISYGSSQEKSDFDYCF